jgi:DNA-binding NarL/FixJ family response regulator
VPTACRILFVHSHRLLTSLFEPPAAEDFPILILVEGALTADIVDLLGDRTVDVAVVEVTPDVPRALAVCFELHRAHPRLPILALACCPADLSRHDRAGLLAVGVQGFMDLNDEREAFLRAVVRVAHGSRVVHLESQRDPNAALCDLVDDYVRPAKSAASPRLTAREHAVLDALLEGAREEDVAKRAYVSMATVKRTIQSLKRKLEAHNLVQLGSHARELGYRPPIPDTAAAEHSPNGNQRRAPG